MLSFNQSYIYVYFKCSSNLESFKGERNWLALFDVYIDVLKCKKRYIIIYK